MAHLITTKDNVWLGIESSVDDIHLIIAGEKSRSVVFIKNDVTEFINNLVLIKAEHVSMTWHFTDTRYTIIWTTSDKINYNLRIYDFNDGLLVSVSIDDFELLNVIRYLSDSRGV